MTRFRLWLVLAAATIAAGVAVPYGILAGGAPSVEIFAFWCIFGLAVVVLIAIGASGWRDPGR